MYTVPEWVTFLLLALYFVPLYVISWIGLMRKKEAKIAFWAPYIIFETCLLVAAFMTTSSLDTIFVGISIGMVLGIPIIAVLLISLIREELESGESD